MTTRLSAAHAYVAGPAIVGAPSRVEYAQVATLKTTSVVGVQMDVRGVILPVTEDIVGVKTPLGRLVRLNTRQDAVAESARVEGNGFPITVVAHTVEMERVITRDLPG